MRLSTKRVDAASSLLAARRVLLSIGDSVRIGVDADAGLWRSGRPSSQSLRYALMMPDAPTPAPRPKRQPVLRLPDGKRIVLGAGQSLSASRRELDVCFVFDTTGSMYDKIDGLVRCMDSLVAELGRMALDWRVTTVPFGDLTVPGDRVVGNQPFVADVQSASRQLRSMPRFSGGGNLGESSIEAMQAAVAKPYRRRAVKILILITDEPALGHERGSQIVHGALSSLDAACFTVAPDIGYYKSWGYRARR